jgi:hypothetical protein
MMGLTRIWCVVALALGGCALDEAVEPAEPSTGVQALEGCGGVELVCGGNTDLIAAIGPYELDKTGQETSSRGFRIVGYSPSLLGKMVENFDVKGANIIVTFEDDSTAIGPQLLGFMIRIQHSSGQAYDMKLTSYLTMPYYMPFDPARPIFYGYYIQYQVVNDPDRGWRDLCAYTTKIDHGVDGTWAVFSAGDRVKPKTGRIFASNEEVGPWFNISCASDALVKSTRAFAMGSVNPSSPVSQRQASLDKFTANYCGDGEHYTELGQDLTWTDKVGNERGASEVEAVWDGIIGAVCLTKPRFVNKAAVPCQPLDCTADQIANWNDYGWELSGLPIGP